MKLSRTFTRSAQRLSGPYERWCIRAITALLVALALLLPAFPWFGQHDAPVTRPPDSLPGLNQPAQLAQYAASSLSLVPGMALAQGGVITKTAPAAARPEGPISYPIVIQKTTPTDWLTNTVVVTDTLPFNTNSPSGAPEAAWSYTFDGTVGRFQNNRTIAGTGVFTVGTFNVVVDSTATNGTLITNTAHLSNSLGTTVSPVVTTTVQAPEFSLAKFGSSSPVCAGTLLTYTVVVSNVNPDTSPAGVIDTPYVETDRLPAGVTLISASDSPVTSSGFITWTMTGIANYLGGGGANSVTRTAVVSVPYGLNDGDTLTNYVTVAHATVPSDSYTLPLTVTKLTPDFTSNSPVAFGAPAVFSNTTVGEAAFGWDFGDGNSSSLISPTHTYTSGGVFTVTLTATSTHGCGALSVTHPVTVVTPATVTVTANPTNTFANGISNTLVTAVVSDTFGAPIAGQPLTFTTSLGNWAGDGQSMVITTDGAGIASNTLTSTVAGTAYITVTAPNGISGTTQVIFDLPNLALNKFDTPDPVQAGATLTYTLIYTNQSNVTATNVWITDTLPTSVTLNTSSLPTTTQLGNVIGWNISSVPPYSNSQILLTVLVNSPLISGTLLTNTAAITTFGMLSENTARVTTTVESSHTLVIVKSDSPDPVDAGATLDYTLTYTVTGNELAVNATVTDTLPANTIFDSASGGITPVGGVLTWNLGTLSPPDSGVLTYSVGVSSPLPNGTVLTNTGQMFDTNGGLPIASTVTTTVVSSHTLHLLKRDNPDPVDAGTTLSYTLAYSVTGNETAQSVSITDTVPADTGFASASGGVIPVGGIVTWNMGDLAPGAAGVLTMAVTVDTPLPNGTVLTNTGRMVDMNGGLPVSSTVTTTVVSSHTLHLLKSDNSDPVNAGGTLTYTLAYSVTGNEIAQSVSITDTVPADTAFASASGGVSPVGGVVTWPLGNLLPGAAGTLTMTVLVDNPLPDGTVLTNTGQIFDANGGVPASSTVTTTVISTHTLHLLKSDNPDPVDAGATLTYTLAYSVTGNEIAQSVTLTDAVPANTAYDTCSGGVTCNQSGGVVTWTLNNLNPGAAGTLTMTVLVNIPLPNGTVLTNTGHIFDANSGVPASSTVTTTVTSHSDITFTKSANPSSGSLVSPGETITYTLVAANTGSQMATGVVLTDTLPVEVNSVNATGSKAPAPVLAGNLLTWNIGPLTTNETVTATIQVTVTTPLTSGLIIANQGQLFTAQTGISTTNTVTHSVISTPTLTLNKSVVPASGSGVSPGQTITYTLTITNSGSGPATNFQITDTVPVSANLVSVSATPGFSTIAGTDAITVNGTLDAGAAMQATIGVTVAAAATDGTILSNIGYVSYAESPAISATNQVTHVVQTTPALSITKVADPPGSTIGAGDTLTYTVIVTNTGAFAAANLVLTDITPANTNYVAGSASTSLGAINGVDPLRVAVDPLNAGQAMSVTFQVTVTTPITNGTLISNAARIEADFLPPTWSNSVTHTVVSTPDLVISKSAVPVSGTEMDPGDPILYFVRVQNNGTANVTNLTITDTMPISTEYVLSQRIPPVGTETIGDPLVWNIPTLAGNGGQVEYRIVVTVTDTAPPGLVFTNTAQISSDQTVLTTTNPVTHQVRGAPQLTVTKTALPLPGTGLLPGDTITYTVTATNTGATTLTNVMLVDLLDGNTSFVSSTATPATPFVFGPSAMWATLAPNSTVSLEMQVTVTDTVATGTIISNVGTGSSAETGVIATQPVTHVIISPALAITKTDNVNTAQPGDTLTYTVTISNNGTAPASNLVITDTVPAHITYVGGSASGGGGYNAGTGEITWTIASLNVGAVTTRTFAVTVDDPLPAGVTAITNTASVADDSGGLATAQDVDSVVAAPNLQVSKSPGGFTQPGWVITYTLAYTNAGNQTAGNVTLTEAVPADTVFNAGSSSAGWTCADNAPAGTPCLLNIGALAGGNTIGSATFAVTVTTPLSDGTVISNTAYIGDAASPVITPSNTVTHLVQVMPNLIVDKSTSPPSGSSVSPADSITYTLTVTNTGAGDATGVVITDALDANVNLVSVTPAGAVSSTSPLVLDGGTLAAGGGSASFTVVVSVTTPLTNGTVIYNQAQAASAELPAATPSNAVTHTVVSTPNLVITKYAGPPSGSIIDPGDAINYYVRVVNTGNAPVTNLVITDALPISTSLSLYQLTPSIGSFTGLDPLVAEIPVLDGLGGTNVVQMGFSVNVTTSVPAGLVISNTAQVVSDQTALTNTNTVTHPVRQAAVLNISKSADPSVGSSVQPGDTLTYTITVNNTGAGDANQMTLSDFLPADVSYVAGSVNTSPGFAVESTAPTLVITGTLAAGGSMTATLQVTVSTAVSGTILTNTAQATATNAALVSTAITHGVVVPSYSVTISKDSLPPAGSVVEPGDLITYTVTVTNTGDPVSNVLISDTLDSFVTLVNSSTTRGSVTSLAPLQVSGFGLASGETATVTLATQVNGVISGTIITNRGSITATELAALQTSGLITHVISNTLPLPNLAITKTATPPGGSSLGPNLPITYSVVVANNGTGNASNVLITDTLPSEVNLVNATVSSGAVGSSSPVTASIPTLTAGDSVTLTVVVTTSIVATDTVITNTAQTVGDTMSARASLPVTHVITTTPPVLLPNLAITKSADPASGSVVEPGDTLTYTIIAQNTGSGAATGVVISDTLDPNVGLTGSSSTAGSVSGGNPVQVTGFDLNPGAGVTVTLVVTVSGTTSGTVISNRADVTSSEVVTPQLSGSVAHPVQGSTGGSSVYLPIIMKNFTGSYLILQWDNVEPVRDRVTPADGAAGVCFTFPCDGQNDGVFQLTVNIGSEGPKAVSNIRLVSTQGVEWNTIPGDGLSTLGVFNGGPLNSSLDGSLSGVLFNSGQVTLQLFATDNASTPRFLPGQHSFTVTINFSDGTSLSASTIPF